MTENYSKIFKGVSYTDEENITGQIFFIAVSTISLVLLSFINFHMFHLSVEIFSALISFAILMISINTYNISKNDFFMFLGIGYTFVGMLDLLHAFSYSTMDIMPNASVNMVAQFWESARLYELVTVLISSIIVRKKIVKPNYLLTVLFQLLIFICIIWANVNLNSMPILRYESGGQTNLKIMIDYMISFGFLICTVTFYKARKLMDKSTFYYIELSLILKVIYELLFTLYFTDTDITSVFGHLFKVLSFYFIYRGIIVNGLQRPFNLLTCTLGNADSTIREKEEQRQFMEDAISRNEQCYDLIIDNSGDGIVIAVDDRLIYANTTAVKKFEANDVTELIGMKLTDLIHEDFTAKTDERIAQFIKSKTGTPFIEINLKSLSGKKIFVEGSLNHIVYRGKPASLAIFRNITAQEKINSLKNDIIEKDRQIIESNEYNRAIMEFFSNMSHELKTPLNIILGSIQLMSIRGEEDLPENFENKLRKYLLIMKQNTFRLIRIVNNIIDTTKYDSGYLNISMHNQNIVSIVEEITLSAGDYIRNRGITLVFDTNIEEKIIAVDADKIERIMLNLLSNSIKFTDEGGSISVNIYDKGDSVEISVKDTGIGIPEEKQNIIFDRFGQVDKTFTRNREGSRIGLSLVRMLAEMHGGTVSVRSKIGEGSEFIIMLPANLIEEENDCAFTTESKVDKINIEFSDIYSVD